MRDTILTAGLIELLGGTANRAAPSGTDLVPPCAFNKGTMMACLQGETIDQIAALIDTSRALSGVLALVLASTPLEELSANEIDALTDLSYKIHLDLDQLKEIWARVSDELARGRN